MAWQSQLQPCSWRGVACHYKDFEDAGGRRGFTWEFIDSDAPPLSQDLGRRARRYRCELYVVGDDFFARRDALVAALEAPGPGTFVHPYEGPLRLRVDPQFPYRVRHMDQRGRSAWFEVLFVEAASSAVPQPAANTAGASQDAAANAVAAQQAAFAAQFLYTGQPNPVQLDALAQMNAAIAAVAFMATAPGIVATEVNLDLAALAVAAPGAAFGAALGTLFDDYVTALLPVLPLLEVPDQTADGAATSSRGAWPVADPSYGLAALAAWQGPAVPSGLQPQAAVNAAALAALVQGAATASLALLDAQTVYASSDDVAAAQATLAALLDQAIASAEALRPAGIDAASRAIADDIDALVACWSDLYQAAANDFAARALGLPNLVQYRTARPRPSLALANRLYPDRLYADAAASQPIDALAYQLVARNRAVHPLFMPLTGEGLAPGTPT